MLWVGLQCVIVVFPDHTHLLSEYGPESSLKDINKYELDKTRTRNAHVQNEIHVGA